MLRWTAEVTHLDRVRNDPIRQRFGVTSIVEKQREARLRWFGQALNGDTVRKTGLNLEAWKAVSRETEAILFRRS